MANAVESEMSDVDWLVMRARSFPRPYSAKAWLITAKSLFPQSFVIQFESYLAEKAAKNVDEAARHLQDMLQSFPQQSQLWDEVHSIMDSLQKDPSDQRVNFLTDLFAAIPTSIQCQMLLKVSESISDVLERCKLLLLAMEKFPNLVQEHGLKLIEMLVKEETNSGIVNNPVNRYRKLLVCDVMPLVLQKIGHLDVNIFHLYVWLQRAIEFYISHVSQPPTIETTGDENQMVVTNRGLVGLNDAAMQVADPWGSLFRFLLLIGERLKWDVERGLSSKSKEYQIQSLNHQLVRAKAGSSPETNNKQILYTALVLFAHSFLNYVSFVDTESSHSVSAAHQVPVVLVEGILRNRNESSSSSRPKKSKTENTSMPVILPSPTISAPAVILHCFETAIMCMEILNSSEEMKLEFYNFCQNWQSQTQQLLSLFQTDMNIHQGKYQDALDVLQNPPSSVSVKIKARMSLQLACCYFCQKKYLKAAELALEISENISICTPNASNGNVTDSSDDRSLAFRGRYVLLLQMTPAEVFPYCLQLIVAALREKMMSPQRSDSVLAHLIILLQFDWPKQEALFAEVISVIQKQSSFTYNNFFSYVHLVDILEEFAFLDTLEEGKVNLDIMPISTKALVQQRTVTRGVNKGVKEDFKAALEKQVGVITESTDVVIQRFLKDERAEILKNLNS